MTAVFLCFRLCCLHDCLPILSFAVILRLLLLLLLLFLVVLIEPVEQRGELTGNRRRTAQTARSASLDSSKVPHCSLCLCIHSPRHHPPCP